MGYPCVRFKAGEAFLLGHVTPCIIVVTDSREREVHELAVITRGDAPPRCSASVFSGIFI
jgi:hypothetical protein